MLSFRSPSRPRSNGSNGRASWRELLFSKAFRAAVVLVLLSTSFLAFIRYRSPVPTLDPSRQATQNIVNAISEGAKQATEPHKGRLHLLVPTTSSNVNLCKLLLSAHILGYPTPILLNFGDHEEQDEYVQHLAKVQGIYDYLLSVEADSEYKEDLVLIIDAWDLWFKLRPDVLLKRYYAVNKAADQRTREKFGEEAMVEHNMRQTVLFGPDKICWPVDYSRPACWAVPDGNLPKFAFGPQTSNGRRETNQPIWLNSGTIMGPVRDLLEVFRATLDEIHNNHVTDSDQFYFANLFGTQELARLRTNPELLEARKQDVFGDDAEWARSDMTRNEPATAWGQKVEYHIGIDYASVMFQTLAFWKQYLTWTREIDSWTPPDGQSPLYYPGLSGSPYSVRLSKDIHESLPPFSATRDPNASGHSGVHPSWSEVELLYNVVAQEAPVMIHFTGEKAYRHFWWQRMWFQSRAEELRLASLTSAADPLSEEEIEGLIWYPANPDDADEIVNNGKGGAWDDRSSGFHTFKRLCKPYEEELYNIPSQEFYHPAPESPEEPQPPEVPQEPEASNEDDDAEGGMKQDST